MTLGIPSTPGVPLGRRGRHDRAALQRRRRASRPPCARVRRGARRDPRRAGRGQHGRRPAGARVPRGAADARATRRGALLVFDEVITGFRVARGGAQERYGVTPDLTILGKIVGGGLPAAAFGGRAELMERLAPVGDVYQAGTLSGNPLATAAGISVLRRLRDPAVYERARAPRRAARGGPRAVRHRAARRRDADALLPGRPGARLRRRRPLGHRALRGALPPPARRGASTWRRPSSSACSSRSRTATRRSTGRSRPLATSSATEVDRLGDARGGGGRREPALGRGAASGRGARTGARCSRRSATPASRSASRRSTRATCSTTGARGSSHPPTPTRRSCSATTSTPTASSGSPRPAASRRSHDLAELISLCAQARAEGRARRGRGLGGDRGVARARRARRRPARAARATANAGLLAELARRRGRPPRRVERACVAHDLRVR